MKYLQIETIYEIIRLADLYFQVNKKTKTGELVPLSEIPSAGTIKERTNLYNYVNNLSDNEIIELTALLWIGRGDFDPKNWDKAFLAAQKGSIDPNYIVGKKYLANQLRTGLEKLNA